MAAEVELRTDSADSAESARLLAAYEAELVSLGVTLNHGWAGGVTPDQLAGAPRRLAGRLARRRGRRLRRRAPALARGRPRSSGCTSTRRRAAAAWPGAWSPGWRPRRSRSAPRSPGWTPAATWRRPWRSTASSGYGEIEDYNGNPDAGWWFEKDLASARALARSAPSPWTSGPRPRRAATGASGRASSAPLARPPSSSRVRVRARPAGSRGAGLVGEPGQPGAHRVLVGQGAVVEPRLPAGCLGGGVDERAPAVAVASAGVAERVEERPPAGRRDRARPPRRRRGAVRSRPRRPGRGRPARGRPWRGSACRRSPWPPRTPR